MTYLPPRAADGTPLTYAEDHCALRWPLVLLGTAMPILSIVAVTVGAITGTREMAYVTGLFIAILVVTNAGYLPLVWPTGMRIDAEGIRVGGIRYSERHPNRDLRRKPPPPRSSATTSPPAPGKPFAYWSSPPTARSCAS